MKVAIIGGGLAGMTTALRLAENGAEVELFEATNRLGGKAGADYIDGVYEEHGYHLFAGWYINTREILKRLNIKLKSHNHYYFIEKDKYPNIGKQGLLSLPHAFNLWDSLLWNYFIIDFCSSNRYQNYDEPYQNYISRKWYHTKILRNISDEHTLKAFSISPERMSAKTAQMTLQFMLGKPRPLFSTLLGDLQSCFILPFEELLVTLGVKIHKNSAITAINVADEEIDSFVVNSNDGKTQTIKADNYIIACQFEHVQKLLNTEILKLDDHLNGIFKLESRHMVALHLYLLNNNILAKDLTFLSSSRFALTFLNQLHQWQSDAESPLSLIAADFEELMPLADKDVITNILEEARQYIPIQDHNLKRYHLSRNVESPLYINVANSWDIRPEVSTAIPNLFFAGDYVRNPANVSTMEGAVASGLNCAAAILKKSNIIVPHAKTPFTWPKPFLKIVKWLLLPIAFVIWVLAKRSETNHSSKEETS